MYIGLIASTRVYKHAKWLDADHASHWAWTTHEAADRHMQVHRKAGQTTAVLMVWAPVRPAENAALFEVGPPKHHEENIRSLCWVIAREDIPSTWAWDSPKQADGLEWRHSEPQEPELLSLSEPKKLVSRPSYASFMERPNSSIARAKTVLGDYYVEHGILPTVQRLAQLLEMASTSSAHYVVKRLREQGFLGSSEYGKLTPGPTFLKAPAFPEIPAELLSQLPSGPGLRVMRVDETWTLEKTVLDGDLLILGPEGTEPEEGDLLVLKRGQARALAYEQRKGWRVDGVVLGQYRRHGR